MKIKLATINIYLIALIAVAAIFQVVILNWNSTTGVEINRVLERIEKIEKENKRLSQQIASSSAIITILTKAKESGFTNSQLIVSLATPLPLALSDRTSL